MEKKRVEKGEDYWFINESLELEKRTENGWIFCDYLFKIGNYFLSKDSAEVVARQLRAVLKGADVIEIPSDEEIKIASKEYNNGSLPNDFDYRNGFKDGVFYLESKIVK